MNAKTRANTKSNANTKATAVLVAYDSKLGSTAEVARFIGETLREQHPDATRVEVRSPEEVEDLAGYDQVVIGSAIRFDRWLPDATAFVEAHREALSKVPVALFFTCLALAKPGDGGAARAETYARQLRALLPDAVQLETGGFAGVLSVSRGPWYIRLLLRVLSRISGVKPGDYRDWEAIGRWSRNLWGQRVSSAA